jgi:hypothetical protein
MSQYLLLRDNKQTGPYTAEELLAKGLKPYDLVWEEGRSAAWRYPSELEELKAFAPVVEEQPFDRFYKKPADQTANAATTTSQQQQTAAVAAQEQQPVNAVAEKAAAKHIHVTLPATARQTTAANTAVAHKEVAKPVTTTGQNKQTAASSNNASTKKAAASSYIVSQEDDEQNSSLLAGYQTRKKEDDEINNSFLSDYESRKAAFQSKKSGAVTAKQETIAATTIATATTTAAKAAKQESLLPRTKKESFDLKALLAGSARYLQDNRNLTRTLVACVLILGGVVIGLIINSGHRQPDTEALESLVKEIRDQQNEKAAASSPVNEKTPKERNQQPAANENYDQANSITEQTSAPATNRNGNQPSQQPVLRHAVLKKENNTSNAPIASKSVVVPVSNTGNTPVEPTPAIMEQPREKPANQEMLEKARKNIYELVHIEASAFKVGLLGGVSDLDITVTNSSPYPLDQVAVEIKYFGMEKKLVKSQTLVFNNVPPGKRRTQEVPRTNRGISIDYAITSINSKALGLAQNGY